MEKAAEMGIVDELTHQLYEIRPALLQEEFTSKFCVVEWTVLTEKGPDFDA